MQAQAESQPALPTTFLQLRAVCRHHYKCSLGYSKCRTDYGWCEEYKCPAFSGDDRVPVELLVSR
jgi:hypothetical protein